MADGREPAGEHGAAEGDHDEDGERFAGSGGGDHALASRCLLASQRDDEQALRTVLGEARDAGDLEAQVLALDALARLSAAPDPEAAQVMPAHADELLDRVRHLLDDADRIDASLARSALPVAEQR